MVGVVVWSGQGVDMDMDVDIWCEAVDCIRHAASPKN